MNEFQETSKVILIYLDENNEKKIHDGIILKEIRADFCFFQTAENILIIPIHRILKIKKPRRNG